MGEISAIARAWHLASSQAAKPRGGRLSMHFLQSHAKEMHVEPLELSGKGTMKDHGLQFGYDACVYL